MAIFVSGADAVDIFLEWNVALDNTIKPVLQDQPV
jgi:iron transport multicopper oxidase